MMPGWWNGLHSGLKIHALKGVAGSNPASGTNFNPTSKAFKIICGGTPQLPGNGPACHCLFNGFPDFRHSLFVDSHVAIAGTRGGPIVNEFLPGVD